MLGVLLMEMLMEILVVGVKDHVWIKSMVGIFPGAGSFSSPAGSALHSSPPPFIRQESVRLGCSLISLLMEHLINMVCRSLLCHLSS